MQYRQFIHRNFLLFFIALIAALFVTSVLNSSQTDAALVKSCTYTLSKDKKSITGDCGEASAITYKQQGMKYVYTPALSLPGGVGNYSNLACGSEITPQAGNASKATLKYLGTCSIVGSKSITIKVANQGESSSAVREALVDLKNKECAKFTVNSLKQECLQGWDFSINECIAENGATDTENGKKKVAQCISSKRSVSLATVEKALEGVVEETQLKKKIEDCRKDNKDYDEDLDKCVEQCTDGQTLDEDGKCTDTTACAVDGIGWMICPIVGFLGRITDEAYNILSNSLLAVNPSMFDRSTESGKKTFEAWSAVQNIANVSFVIAFMIIIYSQVTGGGISNYGIKRILPRLIIAAILVNASFWICAIAVDLSNVLGFSIKSFLDPGDGAAFEFTIKDNGFTSSGNGWSALIVAVLAAGAVVYLGLSVLLPGLIIVLFALVTVVAVLAIRQALIILLVVIAPLAFVAWLLPNTEDWFKRWLSLFRTLLLMFPIIGLIFGASALAATVVMASSDSMIVQVVGALITAVPLFITPIVMKTAGGVLNRFAGIVNNSEKGAFDRMKNSAGSFRERQETRRGIRAMNGGRVFGRSRYRRQDKKNAIDANLKSERSQLGSEYIANKAVGDPGFARKLAGSGPLGRGADAQAVQRAIQSAQFTLDEIQVKEVKAARVSFEREGIGSQTAMARLSSPAAASMTGAERTALRGMVVDAGDAGDMETLWNQSSGWDQSEKNAFAADISKNKPTGVGMGAIAQMREGDGGDFRKVLAKGIAEGRYDPQGGANSDPSELKIVQEIITTDISSVETAAANLDSPKTIQEVTSQLKAATATAASDGRYGAGKSAPILKEISDSL